MPDLASGTLVTVQTTVAFLRHLAQQWPADPQQQTLHHLGWRSLA